ncbi:MAG: hypothetical protein J5829_08330 [Lachnospiraceae bacterium]|nr:hypothetical protein [Lachnospiraceae bacterium]
MRTGLQYNIHVTKNEIRNAGIDILGAEYEEYPFAGSAAVVRISHSRLEQAVLDGALDDLSLCGAEVLVIETIGLKDAREAEDLLKLLIRCAPGFKDRGLAVCIENGYAEEAGKIYRGALGDGTALAAFLGSLNEKAGEEMFGAAFNVGCARLLRLQITEHMKALGKKIRVLYLSDNDGRYDLRQMPYTFTTVHSTNCAQWEEILEYVSSLPEEIFVIGDIRGTFASSPAELKGSFLDLFAAVLEEWNSSTKDRQITLPIEDVK